MREDLDLFKQDWITDPMLDYDKSDSDESVHDARREIAHITLEEETSDSNDILFDIPTSNAGLVAMDVSMKDCSFIPLHTVLNNCGMLLV